MASLPQQVAKHPNASTATGLSGLGVAAVWLLGRYGVTLSGEESVMVGGAVTSAGLFVGKRGIRGVFRLIWRGSS